MLVDTHAHLDFPEYEQDLLEVIERAKAEGVEYILVVGTDLPSSKRALALSQLYQGLFASLGIHPHEASHVSEGDWQELKGLAREPKVVAVGETGLDYHYNYSTTEDQKALFRRHIELALESNLPLIIHNREATQDCISILREYATSPLKGVFHCFSGSTETVKEVVNLGFYISFAGPVTFPNAHRLREVVKSVPVERLLIETDSPFLAPQPKRGKRNEPSYIKYLVPVLAQLYGLSEEDISRITSLNAFRLLGLGTNHQKGKVAYAIRNSLYLNITNRCSNSCTFCPRESLPYVKGHYLGLEEEPTPQEIMEGLGDVTRYDEVVFCGYGEPTERLEVVKTVARYLRNNGVRRIRLNTNGQGDLINRRSVSEELRGLIDSVCISLNSQNNQGYKLLCSPSHGDRAYQALLSFTQRAREVFPEVTMTVVDIPGVDIEACRQIASNLGVGFRVRRYNDLG